MRSSSRYLTLVVFVLTAIAGCSRREPKVTEKTAPPPPRDAAPPVATPDAATDPDLGFAWYRIEARVDELGTVPFIIGVHRDRPEGVIYGGEERLPLVVLQRDPLSLRIPVRGIELRLGPNGIGKWIAMFYYKRDFDIVAEPIAGPKPELLFTGGEAPTVDVTGAWRFDIKDFGVGRAHFRQDKQGTVVGTIIPPEIGDLRHLTGRVTGDRGRLSAFDGIHGFFLDLNAVDGGKKLKGTWLIAGIGKFSFTATRDEPPPTHLKVSARLAKGKTRITLPELDRPEFRGKPVIVDYFGSWCPVCLDLTPELVRMQKQHGAAGLQVLSFALEPIGDEVETARRLEEFRKTFGMTWPFEIRYTDDFNGAVPKEILDATGFPVTIFLRRDHTVSAIHTGFVSRAAGAEHDEVVKLLDKYTAEIVASPPPP